MSSIVQKVHGVISSNGGTLSFAAPTVTGNCIVVIWAFVSTGSQFPVALNYYITDDSGSNVYDTVDNKQYVAYNTFSGNNNVIYGITAQDPSGGTSLSAASMQTLTFDHWLSPPIYVWAYEVSYSGSSDAPGAFIWYGDASPRSTNTDNSGTTQVVPDTGHTSGNGGDTSPKVNLLFAAVAPYSSSPSSVADGLSVGTGWTLDTVQNGWGVAYAEVTGSGDQQAAFTNGASAAYAGLYLVIADVQPAAPPGPGNIVVTKATSPSGSPGSFVFTPSWGARTPFTLSDGESHDSGPLTAGTYSVVESPFTGWTISTSSDPSAISVTDGTTTTITFTNTAAAGGGAFVPGDVQPWLVSIEDHLLTINDLDGGADLADLIFNVQDRRGLITADFPGFVFEGKKMRLLAGFDGMNRADFVTLFTGKVDSIESANANTEYVFTCPDVRQELTRTIYTVADDGFPTDSSHPRTLNGHPLDILMYALQFEVGLDPADIDIAKITQYRDTAFNGVQFKFSITTPPVAKDFLENEIMKPLGAYLWPNNLGQVTVNFYYPLSIVPVIDFNPDNLIEIPEAGPADLINEVSVRLDYDSSDSPQTEIVRTDAASVAKFGLYGNHIIEAKGLRSGLQGAFIGALTAWLIFLRYSFKQLMFGSSNTGNGNANPISALWSTCLVEPGDIATLTHPQVPDRNAGVIGVTAKTFTVMDRQWQFFPCLVQLKLLETDLSKFKHYLIAPNGEADYSGAGVADQGKYMFMAGDDDLYLHGEPGNTVG